MGVSKVGAVLTHVQATHEAYLPVNDEQLLMVGPEEHHVIGRAVECLEGISRGLGETKGGEVSESVTQLSLEVITRRCVIWVPENTNIWVKCL